MMLADLNLLGTTKGHRLQYAAGTDAACVVSGRGEVRQEFRMFVEIWSEYSWLAASAPQKQ